jgi:hypothetical protein
MSIPTLSTVSLSGPRTARQRFAVYPGTAVHNLPDASPLLIRLR